MTGADSDFEAVDLSPIGERVEWAGRHIERLRKLVDAYVSSRPFAVYLYHDPVAATVLETVTLTADPPLPISLVLGDVAHHLRAALDNLVGILRLGGPTRATAFPIAATKDEFERLARQMMAGVPAWGVQAVRELQPFDPERGSLGMTLDVVDQIAQRDRHRALLLHAPLLETDAVHRAVGVSEALHFERKAVGNREIELRYAAASVVRFDYAVRIVVGEDIDLAHGEEVVRLAEGWLIDVRRALGHVDDAADAEWMRLHNTSTPPS